ncbi:NAD-dependent succinate-semialdehyde dehydrogenase [Amphritea sp. 2_MG-2023]|uniref:NAD-dependent succinate-semialdehyde dehydrogenase n=1 Tax=Amphritea TaxID=515417 RepID=UPI001C07E762|nr:MULTISPECIES: NAD-dependent succinate-semialdehyde dehydrogenase [Amphritea]MBU2966067.1 NAD-dependent succinate-semialdehyde dehydrogenase [Amphritea atlantica]MDO6418158.1 NAD-dependent succinate-semialdehyde dehydrogenase [Amphritea sp. 2_MG-2023]
MSILDLNDSSLLKTQAYINGQWIDAESGKTFDVTDPATGNVIAKVADLGVIETRYAIEMAEQAMQSWKKMTAKERSVLLRKWFDLVIANQDDLATIMTAEQGKVLSESKGEVAYGASFIEWFAEEAKRIYGDVIPNTTADRRSIVIKQPIGVVAAVTPWNFPNAMITRKAAPALAVGCAIVLKPAAETPLSALALAELADRAGIPAGLFNVVVGLNAPEIGFELTSNPIVKKFTFTGSTPVGKLLMQQCAQTVKRTSMELGGNAPVLVFADADLDKAVDGAIAAKYRNAGQTCICANRIIVQDSIYDMFVEKFTAKVKTFSLGNGFDSSTTLGPLITAKAAANVDSLVVDAQAKGATVTTGGKIDPMGNTFYQPTVLANLSSDMRIAKEEIFGPVAPIFTFSTEEEAIAMANATEFGLASYLFTKDISRVWRVSEAIDYGMVGINEVSISSEVIPFGGVKESGQGREGSKYGLDDYLEIKYICMGDI